MTPLRRVHVVTVPRLNTAPIWQALGVMNAHPSLQIIGAHFYLIRHARVGRPRWEATEFTVFAVHDTEAPGIYPYPSMRRLGFGMFRTTAILAMERCAPLGLPEGIDGLIPG